MECLLIFDSLNDIVYSKYNGKFKEHFVGIAKKHGLVENENDVSLNANVIMQIFSPMITSQRVMSCQFGNSYASAQCKNGINLSFDEFMGYIFVKVGNQTPTYLKRALGVCVALVKHICGPDVMLLKNDPKRVNLLTSLLNKWSYLYANDQSMLVEALEHLTMNVDLNQTMLKLLKNSLDTLKSKTNVTQSHALLFVRNKFVTLYSSKTASDLTASDLLFLSLFCSSQPFEMDGSQAEAANDTIRNDEYVNHELTTNIFTEPGSDDARIETHLILLQDNDDANYCQTVPHIVHTCKLSEGVHLLVVVKNNIINITTNHISDAIYDIFTHVCIIQDMPKEDQAIRNAFNHLERSCKVLQDGFRKIKKSKVEERGIHSVFEQLYQRWQQISKKYHELSLNGCADFDILLNVEALIPGFYDCVKQLAHLVLFDERVMLECQPHVIQLANDVAAQLVNFNDFLLIKAKNNLALESSSLAINKYLEEFPGLVHFLYIDRSTHRVTAPSLEFSTNKNISFKDKIWKMVDFSRAHLQDGHFILLWKDSMFSYSYFLWFEDTSGNAIKPKINPLTLDKTLPLPGILAVNFYRQLTSVCFPKTPSNKIKCFEMFCIHLGLATSSCVLEHSVRLASTIWDVSGSCNNPIDLL